MSVGPPFSQWITWWAWQKLFEAAQTAQPLSRTARAMRCAVFAWRYLWPNQRGWPFVSNKGRHDVGVEGQLEEFAGC